MELNLEAEDAKDWSYRGEGSLNIVLAYGGSSTQLLGKVLRIQKVAGKEQLARSDPPLTEIERLVWMEEPELARCRTKEVVNHLYTRLVMSPLLNPAFVDPGICVRVSRDFLIAIEKKVDGLRPPWRVAAANICHFNRFAILISDHSVFPTGGPCLSVEIKPKCGFLPTSKFIDEQHSFKKNVTRYQMHQLLKLNRNEVSEISQYDPLDLFSGDKDRIQKAVRDLYATPQNNLRVFLNGILIFGGLGGGTGKTSPAITNAFEQELQNFIMQQDESIVDSFIKLVADTIYDSGVLDPLLQAQKLDKLDIEGVIHAYYNIVSQPCSVCSQLPESERLRKFGSLHSMGMDECLKIVKEYLIATTAKDCSIMISYKPKAEGSEHSSAEDPQITLSAQTFNYKVNYIDLDLKSVVKMEDYYKLDKKILMNYARTTIGEYE